MHGYGTIAGVVQTDQKGKSGVPKMRKLYDKSHNPGQNQPDHLRKKEKKRSKRTSRKEERGTWDWHSRGHISLLGVFFRRR